MILDDKEIKLIGWQMDGMPFECITVGENNITKIDCVEQYCGEYSIHWFQVWSGNNLVSRYNAKNVDTIQYNPNREN